MPKVVVRTFQTQCMGKKAYLSEHVAERGRTYHYGPKNKNRDIYKCPHCMAWHIGTPTKNEYLDDIEARSIHI